MLIWCWLWRTKSVPIERSYANKNMKRTSNSLQSCKMTDEKLVFHSDRNSPVVKTQMGNWFSITINDEIKAEQIDASIQQKKIEIY